MRGDGLQNEFNKAFPELPDLTEQSSDSRAHEERDSAKPEVRSRPEAAPQPDIAALLNWLAENAAVLKQDRGTEIVERETTAGASDLSVFKREVV